MVFECCFNLQLDFDALISDCLDEFFSLRFLCSRRFCFGMFYSIVIGCFVAQLFIPTYHRLFRLCICCHLIGRRIIVRISKLNSLVRIICLLRIPHRNYLPVWLPLTVSTEVVRELQIASCNLLYCHIVLLASVVTMLSLSFA